MKIKRIIDISRKISPGMVVWPGDNGVDINIGASIKGGDVCNLSNVSMSVHTGTHVDAPLHFIDGGKSVTEVDLSRFIGFAKVFELNVNRRICRSDIEKLNISEGDIVIFKTANSLLYDEAGFQKDFIYIDACAAEYLVERKVKTVGIDYLSIDGYETTGFMAHKLLLGNEIGIIEGVNLKDVSEGEYFLSCLPLPITGRDGSPVRAVLLEVEV